MANRDLMRRVIVSQSVVPAVRVNSVTTGTGVDLRGFDAALFVVAFGGYTDGVHTPSFQHSMDGTTYTTCAASDLDGVGAAVSSAGGANSVQSIGYIGTQRFVRVVMTVTGATTGASSAAQVIAGYPRNIPTV